MQEEKKKSILKHPPRTLARAREPRQDIILHHAPIFQIFNGCHKHRLGGEIAWLKILIIGRTKGVYPATRRTIWEQLRGRLGAKSFRF